MFSSISKAWAEISDEGGSVKFNVEKPAKKTAHYIHYDRPNSTLNRLKRSGDGVKKGSPRILKPVDENRQNSLWGSTVKNISKVFKRDDEISSMKKYMEGMISKPKATEELKRKKRASTLNNDEINNENTSEEHSRRRRRTDTITSRIDELTNSLSRRENKRRRYATNDGNAESTKFDSKLDFDTRYARPSVPKYESSLNSNHSSMLEPSAELKRRKSKFNVDRSWKEYRAQTPSYRADDATDAKKYNITKITAQELPSSPLFLYKSSTPKSTKRSDTTMDSTAAADRSTMDSSKIEELYKKVMQLETTVDDLKEQLKTANEKSLQLEKSFETSRSLLEDSRIEEPHKPDTILDTNISRPLSPVKIDLEKFKLIR